MPEDKKKKKVKKSKSGEGDKQSKTKKDSKKKPLLHDVELEDPVLKASGWEEVEVREAPNHKYAITGNEGVWCNDNRMMMGMVWCCPL
jgi:hypothetical protein